MTNATSIRRSCLGLLAAVLLTAATVPSSAQVCAPTDTIDKYQMLRQLSLDLRGRIPTVEEYEALDSVDEVPAGTLTAMLQSDDFFAQVRNYHAGLMMPTLIGVEVFDNNRKISIARDGAAVPRWFVGQQAGVFRGANQVPCLDEPQTDFDADGRPVPMQLVNASPTCPPAGCQVEGYVMVEPYWAPGTQIRVCAFDAEDSLTGSDLTSSGYPGQFVDCGSPNALNDPRCGCGPNLQWCTYLDVARGAEALATNNLNLLGTEYRMLAELAEEPLRIFENVVREGRPYFEALTTRDTYLTGATTHYYEHIHEIGTRDDRRRETSYDGRFGTLPTKDFADTSWTKHTREEVHAGVLTTLGYMLRFNSNRGRANRFYESFLCRSFQGPAEGLPPSTDPCSDEPDLSKRCGCATCHVELEPAAATFGRWEHTRRFGYLSPEDYPDMREQCATCTGFRCPIECSLYYFTPDQTVHPDEEANEGLMQSLVWRDEDDAAAVLEGPSKLVDDGLASGELARCSVRNLAEHLLKRELSDEEALSWVPEVAEGFTASNYDFTALVRTLVEHESYRATQ